MRKQEYLYLGKDRGCDKGSLNGLELQVGQPGSVCSALQIQGLIRQRQDLPQVYNLDEETQLKQTH